MSIRGTQRKDHKSTSTGTTKERRKVQSGNRYLRTWYRRSIIPREGKWKPIAFLSRTIQPAERNYEIYDKELLAIVEALTKWRQYLLDAAEPFEVWMDHENLKYFREPHKLNGRQAR